MISPQNVFCAEQNHSLKNPAQPTPPRSDRLSTILFENDDLPPGKVHFWSACLDAAPFRRKELERSLSQQERARADRFQFDRDRVRYVAGLGILRSILGSYLGVEPASVEFRYESNGKPALSGRLGRNPIRFNMSRSKGLALYAFSRDREVGIDVEKMDPMPDMDRIVERFFSPREIQDYFRIPVNGRAEAFFRCWTRKEAFLKATGEGLLRPLDTFAVSIRPDEPPRIVEDRAERSAADRWSVRDLPVEEGYAAALVIEGRHSRICCMQRPHVPGG